MTDQKHCPLCNDPVADGKEVPLSYLLMEPIASVRRQIAALEPIANKHHKAKNEGAEFAVLEQIRLLCSVLCEMVRCCCDT